MQHKKSKKMLTAATLALGLTLSGCFTMGNMEDGFTEEVRRENKPVLTDTLVAFAVPDMQTAQLTGQQHLLLVGRKNGYLLTKGHESVLKVAQGFGTDKRLNANQLSISTSTACRLYIDGDAAWGCVEFRYTATTQTNADETSAVSQLGFTPLTDELSSTQSPVYKLRISIDAAVKDGLDLSKVKLPEFQQARQLTFYEPDSNAYSRRPKIGNILLAPIALAADVVTSPLQAIGLGFLVYALTH